MPTPAAERREDEVIALIAADLVRSGCSATILDRPDRNAGRADGLTVDAELAVDAERWALDVTTLRWHQGLEGAVQKVKGSAHDGIRRPAGGGRDDPRHHLPRLHGRKGHPPAR
jgi:hypothetical protein